MYAFRVALVKGDNILVRFCDFACLHKIIRAHGRRARDGNKDELVIVFKPDFCHKLDIIRNKAPIYSGFFVSDFSNLQDEKSVFSEHFIALFKDIFILHHELFICAERTHIFLTVHFEVIVWRRGETHIKIAFVDNIADVVAIINYLLDPTSAKFNEAAANVDGQDGVTLADALAIINKIIGEQ